MSISGIIDRVYPKIKDLGYSRRTGERSVLKLIEQAQDELCRDIQTRQIWLDPSTGWPPYLITQSGVVEYEIKGTNLNTGTITRVIGGVSRSVLPREVLRIFMDVTNTGIGSDRRFVGVSAINYPVNPYTNQNTLLTIALLPFVVSPKLEKDNPVVLFKEDPGATTNKYFVEFTWQAPRLTTEDVPLIVATDFEPAIEIHVLGVALGDAGRIMDFREHWIPEFQREMGKLSFTARSTTVKRRLC